MLLNDRFMTVSVLSVREFVLKNFNILRRKENFPMLSFIPQTENPNDYS